MAKHAPLSSEGDVLVQSWDGVMTPLRETGTKSSRKPERPVSTAICFRRILAI
jgi:hypothetical protein